MNDYADRRPEPHDEPISNGFKFAWFAIGCALGFLLSFI